MTSEPDATVAALVRSQLVAAHADDVLAALGLIPDAAIADEDMGAPLLVGPAGPASPPSRGADPSDAGAAGVALTGSAGDVGRADLARALHVVLFADLLERVPSAADYTAEARADGRPLVLDHAAVRTVAWPAGALPPGSDQVTRLLEPLGYRRHATYDLTQLRMTGHAHAHADRPEDVPQWFVSELHPDTFSPAFQEAVTRVLAGSLDPLDTTAQQRLDRLAAEHALPAPDAGALLGTLRDCFNRLHPLPTDRDHDLLLAESAEMAWIATEGTTANHCTDRVDDVHATADRERERGRPVKDTVEVSSSRRVRQTAHRAATVVRRLPTLEGDVVERRVPGSFFEVISRDRRPDGRLDLAFDAANATGIFAMTRDPSVIEAPSP